jgi:hypothetical protein
MAGRIWPVYNGRYHGAAKKLGYDGPMAPWGMRMFSQNNKIDEVVEALVPEESSGVLRAIGWTSVALAVTALGLYVGRELRIRYKFKRRTPTDLFSHAGEEMGAEYGVGI